MKITDISIASSVACNLNCKYCAVHSNKTKTSLKENTEKALQDGTFLKNVKSTLQKSKIPFTEIERINLWGMEPTLTLHLFTSALSEWLKTFPCVHEFMFSTNGAAYPERILDFIKEIDNTIQQKSDIYIQYSYDGYRVTQETRSLSYDILRKNIMWLVDACNNIKFKYVTIHLGCNSVISKELLYFFDTKDKIEEYLIRSEIEIIDFFKTNRNKDVLCRSFQTFNLESPVCASSEDGVKLYNFLYLGSQISEEHFINGVNPCKELLRHYNNRYRGSNDKKQVLTKAINESLSQQAYEYLNRGLFCGINIQELKIAYDGTILNCQNFLHKIDESKSGMNPVSLEDEIVYSLVEHHYFTNPIKESESYLKNLFYLYDLSFNHCFLFIYQQVIQNMKILAKIGQISGSYLIDEEKLLQHAWMVSRAQFCAYATQIMSGSFLIKDLGGIRFLCNGFLDLVEQMGDIKQ